MIDLEQLLASAETLDPLPASTSRLAAMLADVETPIGDIVRLVSFDQALVGRVLRAARGSLSERLTQICDREGISRAELEEALVESHHSEIGALVASHWELPKQISWAIAAHDDPRFAAPGEGDPLCDAVFLANCMALVVQGDGTPEPSELEIDALRRLGLGDADRQRLIDEVTEHFEEVLTWFE
ncbi:MAG: HDOD domain-containing protein [Planctomycetota bacterium]